MNRSKFEQAQSAYASQDFARALDLYNEVVNDHNFPFDPGEKGLLYHQIGNCLVKLSNYGDAIAAYANAANDSAYVSIGTVYYNLGMAYAFMNDFGNAINNFNIAINTENYRSKYKAYTAMGNALMKSGKSADAAVSFRNAAMDTHNPDPTRALLNLGVCFMALGQADNAIKVYENTFQYNMSNELENRLNANLGQAYVAAGKMQKAVNAFERALRDKTYTLSDSASVDYQRAIASVSKGNEEVNVAQAGAAAAVAAGMAAGASGAQKAVAQEANNADPVSDTFKQNTDNTFAPVEDEDQVFANSAPQQVGSDAEADEFEKWSKSIEDAAKNKIEKKHPLRTFFVVLLFTVAGLIIAGSILFCLGFGFPSQEMIAKQLFDNPVEATNNVFSNDLSDYKKQSLAAIITQDANATVDGVIREVNRSTAYVTGKTTNGAEVHYVLKMSRDIVGWKITNIELSFASNNQ